MVTDVTGGAKAATIGISAIVVGAMLIALFARLPWR
jgi:hypothetical protein